MGGGFAAYYFVLTVITGRHARLARLAAVTFWMLNHYQYYAWEMVRLSEVPLLVVSPVLLALFIRALDGRITPARLLPSLIFFSLLGSSVGVNPTDHRPTRRTRRYLLVAVPG